MSLKKSSIADISPLANLTKLEFLNLSANQITDISPLAKLTKLRMLYLSDNKIRDVSPLSNLTKLTRLDLEANQITDFAPIVGLIPNLQSYRNTDQRVKIYDFCLAKDPVLPEAAPLPEGQFPLTVIVDTKWTKEHTTYTETATDGIVLTVGFEGGDAQSRNLVKEHAPEWSKHGAVRFRFPESSSEWDIIVSFNTGGA